MRANNEKEGRGDGKISQSSITLMLSLTEQLSMHLFNLDRREVVKRPCMLMDGLKDDCMY